MMCTLLSTCGCSLVTFKHHYRSDTDQCLFNELKTCEVGEKLLKIVYFGLSCFLSENEMKNTDTILN